MQNKHCRTDWFFNFLPRLVQEMLKCAKRMVSAEENMQDSWQVYQSLISWAVLLDMVCPDGLHLLSKRISNRYSLCRRWIRCLWWWKRPMTGVNKLFQSFRYSLSFTLFILTCANVWFIPHSSGWMGSLYKLCSSQLSRNLQRNSEERLKSLHCVWGKETQE